MNAASEKVEQERIQRRKAVVERYMNELLPTEYSSGRAVSLWQNFFETTHRVVDFWRDEVNGERQWRLVHTKEEAEMVWREQSELVEKIQARLGENRFSNEQLNGWFGRVTPVQFQTTVDIIAESNLPLFSKSPKETFEASMKSVMSAPAPTAPPPPAA